MSTPIKTTIQVVDKTINSLECWVKKRQWKGYDPYDIQELFLKHRYPRGFSRLVCLLCKIQYGRKILRLHPRWNMKGLGLFLQAYCLLYKQTGETRYLDNARQCAEILLSNTLKPKYPFGWGHPFDWQSRILMPVGTSFTTLETQIADGFWLLYHCTGEEKWLQVCHEICNHWINNYNIDRNVGDNAICFSYSNIDKFHVHNSNLGVGAILAKVGSEIGEEYYLMMAKQCANYAILEMRDDGRLNYWGSDQTERNHEDNYHAGFEIRYLLMIAKTTKYLDAEEAAQRRYNYYCANFIGPNGEPWRNPASDDIVDIHGCAEALLVHSFMIPYNQGAKDRLIRSFTWTLEKMQNKDGSFAYKQYRNKRWKQYDRTPYMRWGQAWMMLGLVTARDALKISR